MHIKTKSLAGEYEFIRSNDPAFSNDAPEDEKPEAREKREKDWATAYDLACETGDFSALPLKEGKTPAVWRFRHLSSKQRAWLRDRYSQVGFHLLALDAVALSLVGAANADGPGGQPLDVKREKDPERHGWIAVCEEQMAWLGDQVDILVALGTRAIQDLGSPRNG